MWVLELKTPLSNLETKTCSQKLGVPGIYCVALKEIWRLFWHYNLKLFHRLIAKIQELHLQLDTWYDSFVFYNNPAIFKTSSRHNCKMSSWRCLEVFLKMSWRRRLANTSWRRLENVLRRRLENVLEMFSEDLLQIGLEDVLEDRKLFRWRRLQDLLKTS